METRNTEETTLPPIDMEGLAATNTGAETQPVSNALLPPLHDQGKDTWDSGYQPSYMPKERPIGVSVIAGVNFVGALLISILLLIAFVEKLDLHETAIIWPISVVCAIAVGIGLVQLKNWARILAFVVYGINVVWDIYIVLTGPVAGPTLIQLAIAVTIILYFRQPKVAEVFE